MKLGLTKMFKVILKPIKQTLQTFFLKMTGKLNLINSYKQTQIPFNKQVKTLLPNL